MLHRIKFRQVGERRVLHRARVRLVVERSLKSQCMANV